MNLKTILWRLICPHNHTHFIKRVETKMSIKNGNIRKSEIICSRDWFRCDDCGAKTSIKYDGSFYKKRLEEQEEKE